MVSAGTTTYALRPPAGPESACTGVTCDVNAAVAIVLLLGGLVLGTLAAIGCLRRARDACEEERRRLLAELDAFEAFVDRVADVTPTARPDGGNVAGGGPAIGASVTARSDTAMDRVRTIYRETVMAVDHYEEDYDESLREHVAAEFGDELAVAMTEDAPLTPSLKRTLVAAGRNACRERSMLASALAEERTDLAETEESLTAVSHRFERTGGSGLERRTYEELASRWRRLRDLEDDCEAVLEHRQRALEERGGDRHGSREAFGTYLYRDLEVTFPVLSATTELLSELREERRETLRAIGRGRF